MYKEIAIGSNAAQLYDKRFYRLTALSPVERTKKGQILWLCVCECGERTTALSQQLLAGTKKSCGCARRDHAKEVQSLAADSRRSHGLSSSVEYYAWFAARSRCYNTNDPKYKWYGARGIRMCKSWRDSVETFVADMGPRPVGLSLDRIDNDGNYEPGNCRWTTHAQQMLNKRQRGKSMAQ